MRLASLASSGFIHALKQPLSSAGSQRAPSGTLWRRRQAVRRLGSHIAGQIGCQTGSSRTGPKAGFEKFYLKWAHALEDVGRVQINLINCQDDADIYRLCLQLFIFGSVKQDREPVDVFQALLEFGDSILISQEDN